VAVAGTGSGNRVMTSPNGITWTSRTSAADNSWLDVAYGNGAFVAVSNSGTGNRVMTSSPPFVTPSVTITANPGNSIITGTSVTFTATPANGGTTPAYQWKKNGNNVGSNSVNYTDAALQNGDIITCVLTSNNPCASIVTATSGGITMAVVSPSNNSNLSALILSAGTLSPTFASATISYTAGVSNAISNITVTPTRADTNASIQVRVNGGTYVSVSSGVASSALALNVGSNTINVLVTAQDASTKTYTITVTRAGGSVSTLNITAFFEGLYLGSSTMTAAPFNADGLTSNTIADTLTIVLHDKNNFDSVFAVTSIIDTAGLASFNLPAMYTGNAYYIAVKHRNSLETWTADTVVISTITSYNFSDNALKAYGSNLVDLGSGVFGIYAGDINQDGSIDFIDYPVLDIGSINGDLGYLVTDLNGDASVDFLDYPLIDLNSINGIVLMRP
jgi:hypothetical protein